LPALLSLIRAVPSILKKNEKENARGYFEKAFQLSGSQSEKQLLQEKITLC
jgi:predicted negative regulator of RcsB-dependent stress response